MAVPLLCLWNHFVLVLSQFVRQAILAGNLRLCSIDQMTVGAAAVTPPTSHGATWMAHQRQVQHFHIFFGVVQTFNTFRMLLKWLHFRRPVLWWPVCVTRWLSNPRWLVCNPLPIDNHDKVWQSGLAKWFPICWGLSSFLQSGFRNSILLTGNHTVIRSYSAAVSLWLFLGFLDDVQTKWIDFLCY